MAYQKQTFVDGQTLDAAHMNHIEDGLETLDTQMGDISAALNEIIALQDELIGGGAA